MNEFARTLVGFTVGAVLLATLGSYAVQAEPSTRPVKEDALIGTSEQLGDHDGAYEDIHDHEGHTEDIHDHGGASQGMQSAAPEKLSDHHADSEALAGRVVESERLHGMGHEIKGTGDRLADARARLAAARARHAKHSHPAAAPASAVDPAAPASSQANEKRYEHWTARIDVETHRIEVAKAALDVWDESYARMIQADYPRGEARQKLIDSRDRARERYEAEQARLPRMIEEARKAGVPPGVLELHTSSGGASETP
jgi:hypothetical protein